MWIVFSLLAAVSAAAVVTLTKAGLKNVDSNVAFAIQSVLIFIVAWAVIWWEGKVSELSAVESSAWVYLIVAGIITCLSSLFTFAALKLGDASRVSPLGTISLAFSIMFAVLFLKERVGWQTLTGAALMIAGALFIAFSSHAEQTAR